MQVNGFGKLVVMDMYVNNEVISSIQNERVKNWNKLLLKKYRDEKNEFLIEEEHLIEEALKCNIVKTIIISEGCFDKFKFDSTFFVTQSVMNKLSSNVSEVKYIAVCKKLDEKLTSSNKVLALDRIQDPGNLGTLLRSALAFGFNQILISDNSVDIYNEKVIRSTQGAIFHLNFLRCNLIETLKKFDNYDILAFSLDNSNYMSEIAVNKKVVIVLGNEGKGISKEVFDCCNKKVKIEMNSFESLNVAVAGSIAMYNFREKNSDVL